MSDKNIFRIIISVSVSVFLVVLLLNQKVFPKPNFVPSFLLLLPFLNACINGTCSILLLLSLYFIRRKNILVHKRLNIAAFFLSSLFLVSYITFHFFAPETKFPVDNPWRPIYLFILITHIILATLVLPFILLTFYRGLNMQVEKHRKIARWSYPIWLYVTVTGVIVYLMISPYYNF